MRILIILYDINTFWIVFLKNFRFWIKIYFLFWLNYLNKLNKKKKKNMLKYMYFIYFANSFCKVII